MNLEALKGVGLGLRFDHFSSLLANTSTVPWYEVILEDFLVPGPHHEKLWTLRQDKPIAFHSVGLNIGGVSPFNEKHLNSFKELYHKFQPQLISDHLCWSEHNEQYHHDLLPIIKSKEALQNTCDRIHYLQDFFQRELCIENITSYIDYQDEDYDELDFIKTIVQKTGCKLLLDITNVTINHKNRSKDSTDYLKHFPIDAVKQVHLSGGFFDEDTGFFIDSHSNTVSEEDLKCLKKLTHQGLSAPILIERDAQIPPFSTLEKERNFVERKIYDL